MQFLKFLLIVVSIFSFMIFFSSFNVDKTGNDVIVDYNMKLSDSILNIIPPKTNTTEKYLEQIGLIQIKNLIPEIIVDLKYACKDNFVGIDFYGELKNAYIQPECFEKLKNAYLLLQKEKPGYSFIIYDAARSIESQQLMWNSINVSESIKHWYIADPKKGSLHNYGMAIDISIIDTNGNVLDMGTKFDYFGDLAFPNKTNYFFSVGLLTKEQYENRNLLMNVMNKAGFIVSKTEWWHYNASTLDYAKSKYQIFSVNHNSIL